MNVTGQTHLVLKLLCFMSLLPLARVPEGGGWKKAMCGVHAAHLYVVAFGLSHATNTPGQAHKYLNIVVYTLILMGLTKKVAK
jgi:hypothetical protein